MKKSLSLLVILAIPALLFAQKNVVPSSQTQMLNIQLPDGSKQDKRLLSMVAAGSFLSVSTGYKSSEITPVEVYSIPVASGFTVESIKGHLTANNYEVQSDSSDSKLFWFTRNNNNWLVYLSQEAKETILYIGRGNMSLIIPGNKSQPVLLASTNPVQPDTNYSARKYPAYVPPLAIRRTGHVPQKIEESEGQMFAFGHRRNMTTGMDCFNSGTTTFTTIPMRLAGFIQLPITAIRASALGLTQNNKQPFNRIKTSIKQ